MPRRYYYYQGFGASDSQVTEPQVTVTAVKGAFYTQSNPVAAFIKAMQKTLGVPQTGSWDLDTHNAFWSWIMAREALTSPGGISDMPSVLPWKPQVCASDGFPLGSAQVTSAMEKAQATLSKAATTAGVNPPNPLSSLECVDTAWLLTEAMDDFAGNNPAFLNTLGFASLEAMRADPGWAAAKDSFAVDLVRHIQSKLAGPATPPVVPPTCPEGQELVAGSCVPVCPSGQIRNAAGVCAPVEAALPPSTSKASIGWILGGLAVAGLLFWAVTRKTTPVPGAKG